MALPSAVASSSGVHFIAGQSLASDLKNFGSIKPQSSGSACTSGNLAADETHEASVEGPKLDFFLFFPCRADSR